MNYRHAYHAGNFADVVKHAILTLILEALRRKDKPFAVLDTHAGIGRYDLAGVEAQRTGEFRDGIGRLIAATDPPVEARAYLDIVRAGQAGDGAGTAPSAYPGSPCIARALLRPQDRLMLVEAHPEDAATLRRAFRGDGQVAVHRRDGYEAMRALLPPPERRGLVLIDPPFESPDEFRRMAAALAEAWARWPAGVYAAWYPIKARGAADRSRIDRFHADLSTAGLRPLLAAELTVVAIDGGAEDGGPLAGSGLIVANPPWHLDEALDRLLPALLRVLDRGGGTARLLRLAGERPAA